MISLADATQAADARKQAAHNMEIGFVFSGEAQDRAIFSGLDVDYDELAEFATRAGRMFCAYSPEVPLRPLFVAAWVEGLLVGLLAQQLAREPTGE